MFNISQKALKLIKNILLFTIFSSSFASALAQELISPDNQKIKLRLATTLAQQQSGLSGIKPKDFSKNEGMLFVYKSIGYRKFWMPDTYFNLDIIFLNSDLKIVAIEKDVPHHIGRKDDTKIYRTKAYIAHHVLEVRADSEFSKKLKVGDSLKWAGPISLEEIVSKTHQEQ